MNLLRRVVILVWEIFESSVMATAVVVVTYLFFFQPGIVHGASSYPTWQENDRFLTDKISYRFTNPSRGDFVVMLAPSNPEIDFIKRIVGLPGERLEIRDCLVYINSIVLEENYLQPGTCTSPSRSWTIPDNFYFVMGDNRSGSSDSRDFGPIPRSSIQGKVILRYWPLDRGGRIR